ncbi:MAG: hypothetical protein AAGG57_19885 [Pseudomonadota bacterium]
MLRRFYMKAAFAPCILAILLGSVVFAAPIVNGNGRPPRAVFLVLPDDIEPPKVSLQVEPFAQGKYRVQIDTTEFQFTDICVAQAQAAPIGHAHVHVNGAKVASAYQPVVLIGPLAPGEHVIDVVLRGQDHRAILGRTGLVQGTVEVFVPQKPV